MQIMVHSKMRWEKLILAKTRIEDAGKELTLSIGIIFSKNERDIFEK